MCNQGSTGFSSKDDDEILGINGIHQTSQTSHTIELIKSGEAFLTYHI